MLLQAFYSVRSERQLMERLEFDLLFRWFVGLGMTDPVWDHSTFSKNRDRLLDGEIAAKFLTAVLAQPRIKRLLSSEHFSVDGTLIEAWASMKSFKPKDPPEGGSDSGGGRNAPADFRGEKRGNESAPTRAMMPPILSRNCAPSTCARMSPATSVAGARRLIVAPRATPAMPPVSASASGSRRHSAGSKRLPACARPSCAACPRWTGASPLPRPPTIWCGHRS